MDLKPIYMNNAVGNFRLLGFVTGEDECECDSCGTKFKGDILSTECLECAIKETKRNLPNDSEFPTFTRFLNFTLQEDENDCSPQKIYDWFYKQWIMSYKENK